MLDLAGNNDVKWISLIGANNNPNEHLWHYNEPIQWTLIMGAIAVFLLLLVLAYAAHRYRKRQLALQRFAMKHMRRKFKRTQRQKANDKKNQVSMNDKDARKAKLEGFAKVAKAREKNNNKGGKTHKKHHKHKKHKG